MDRPNISPPLWRIIAAFVFAPAIAAAAMACYEPLYSGLQNEFERVFKTLVAYCVYGAYPATVIFGIPTFFCLRRRLRPTALNCTLAGGFVATVPWILLLTITPAPDDAIDGSRVTAVHGHLTFWGWMLQAAFIFETAVFGLLGGLAFWLIAAAGSKSQTANN